MENKIAHFEQFINKYKDLPEFLCIQETQFNNEKIVQIKNYNIEYRNRQNIKGGGVAIYIRKDIPYSEVKKYNNFEGIKITAKINNQQINIINIYHPPNEHFDDKYNEIFNTQNNIITGDFNAHHYIWGSSFKNQNGENIINKVNDSNYIILNEKQPTRIHHNGTLTNIDITMATPNITCKSKWENTKENCGSDHFILRILINHKIHKIIKEPKYNFKKADWPKFKDLCLQNINHEILKHSTQKIYDEFIGKLTIIINKTIPKEKLNKRHNTPYWTKECGEKVNNKKQSYKNFLQNRTIENLIQYKKDKAIAQKTTNKAKKKFWENKCQNINGNIPINNIWKVVNNLNQQNYINTIGTIKIGNKMYNNEHEIANIMGKHLQKTMSDINNKKQIIENKKEFIKKHNEELKKQINNEEILNEPITKQELARVINAKQKITAPGEDKITYNIIQQLPDQTKEILLEIYNKIWDEGNIPIQWKNSIITPKLKGDKDKQDINSYRPIALTSTFSKILETIVNQRLNWYLEKQNKYNPNQNAFRNNRDTIDNLINIHNDIYKGIQNKQYTVAVFFDITKAYDMLWQEGLLHKLNKINITGNMFNFIKDFIQKRTIQVKIGNTISQKYTLQNGTPQGSVISPTIFNIMINDLNKDIIKNKLSLYADDIAIWKTGTNLNYILKEIQKDIDNIEQWTNKWGFTLSPAKTKTVIFTNNQIKNVIQPLKINGNNIEQVNSIKFLGIHLDTHLNFKKHIQYVMEKIIKRFNLIKRITGNDWGANKKPLIQIYHAYIRSRINYGINIYGITTKSAIMPIKILNNRILRYIAGATKNTPIEIIENELGIKPLNITIKQLQIKYALKIMHNKTHPGQNIITKDWKEQRISERNIETIPDIITQNNLKNANIQSYKINPIPPQYIYEVNIDTELTRVIKKGIDNNNIMYQYAKEKLQEYNNHYQIYTDGSKINNNTGCGIYIPEIKIKKAIKIDQNNTIFQAEFYAIIKAIEYLVTINPIQGVIITDSLSVLQYIKNINYNNMTNLAIEFWYNYGQLINNNIILTILWIPGHIQIKGNDIADKIAKQATIKTNIDVNIKNDYSQIKNIAKKIGANIWEKQWEHNHNPSINHYKTIIKEFGTRIKYYNKNRRKDTIITQFRAGYTYYLKHYKKKYLNRTDGLCDICKVPETIEHYLINCNKYQQQKNILHNKIKHLNKPINIKTMLVDTIDLTYDYIKNTIITGILNT